MTAQESPVSVTFSHGGPFIEVAMWPDEEAEFEVTEANGGPTLVMRVGHAKIRLRPDIPSAVGRCDITATCRLMAALSAYVTELERHYIERIVSLDDE